MTLQIGQELRSGRYHVQNRLGKGGMGTVYLAIDRNLQDHQVAIKENTLVTKATQQQFQQEAETLARLNHPNLPRVTNFFIERGGRQYLVMDYIDGQNLREILVERGEPLPEKEIMPWIDQIMDALEYMHTWANPMTRQISPIIHRDIKPANIKRTSSGQIYLVDFGIAKLESSAVTLPGARAFSPGFSPVEQYTGGTDIRSDIYALGATLYSLLTRKVPPESPNLVAHKTLHSPRVFNPDISRHTERMILQAMRIVPDDRYQNIQEMRRALTHRWPEIRIPTPRRASDNTPPEPGTPIQSQLATETARRPQTTRQSQPIDLLRPSRTVTAVIALVAVGIVVLLIRIGSQRVEPEEAAPPVVSVATTPATATSVIDAGVAQTSENVPSVVPTVSPEALSTAATATSPPVAPTDTALAVVASPSITVLATATPRVVATPPPTTRPTARPTSTPISSATATPVPTHTATRVAIPTPSPSPALAVASAASAPTRSVPTISSPATSSPATSPQTVSNATITLLEPAHGSVLRGTQTFRWTTDVSLQPGQAFELVFWAEGQTAMQNGFGPVGNSPRTTVPINLDRSAAELTQLQLGRDYRWGILLVEAEPYRRIQYLGGNRQFRLEGSSGSSSGSSSSQPTPTPTPR